MEIDTNIIASVTSIANTAAWIVIAVAFMNGKIFSKDAVDRMQKNAEDMTLKLANEVKDSIQEAVKAGTIEAHHQINSGGQKAGSGVE